MNKQVKFEDLGLIDYQKAWDYQGELMQEIIDIKLKNRELPIENQDITPNFFLFVEHPHIYTLGKSGDESNMLINTEKLKQINADFVKTNRGGDITYHGFGQIVGYPILDLAICDNPLKIEKIFKIIQLIMFILEIRKYK